MKKRQIPLRPWYHFTPPQNWMNDPNGLCYYRNHYHLFYQHNPHDINWGDMSWGHAVSTDLLHWQDRPLALPATDKEMAFSGSVIVDTEGTTPFARQNRPPFIACYTACNREDNRQYQNLAISPDHGEHWQFFEGNPVLDINESDFRDPKIFLVMGHPDWFMVVALPDKQRVQFYRSRDLIHWTFLSEFGVDRDTGGKWECPEMIYFPPEKNFNKALWVLKVDVMKTGVCYFVGTFDAEKFTPLHRHPRFLPDGPDFYAAQTFFGYTTRFKNPLWLGWLNNWEYADDIPADNWRGVMSVPRELFLAGNPEEPLLCQLPPESLKSQFRNVISLRNAGWEHIYREVGNLTFSQWALLLSLDVSLKCVPRFKESAFLQFRLRDHRDIICQFKLGLNRVEIERLTHPLKNSVDTFTFSNEETQRGKTSPEPEDNSSARHRLEIWLDFNSLEVFYNSGTQVISALIFPGSRHLNLELESRQTQIHFWEFDIYEIPQTIVRKEKVEQE